MYKRQTIDSLQRCTANVGDWCASKRLKLNEDKTEFMWCGSRASLKKIASNDLSLRVGNDVITSVNAVRDLGVTLDSELTMSTKSPVLAFITFDDSTANSAGGNSHSHVGFRTERTKLLQRYTS